MSLSWRNELRVVLCPDKVILLGLGRGLRRKVILQTILPCAPSPGVPGWQPALAAFEQWVGANEMGKTNVTVILSNHFVRYVLMPFSAEVTSRAEEQALAQILFEDIYGELATQWQLQIGEGGYGEPRLIAGADSMLLDRIAEILAPSALRLNAITPYLISVFNSFHDQIQDSDGLFAIVEAGQMIVIAFKNGQLSGVRRVLLNGGLNNQLINLLQREALTSGLDLEELPVYLHVAGRSDFELSSDDGINIHWLRHVDKHGAPFSEDVGFDMASVREYA